MAICVILIIALVVVIICLHKSKESYGELERNKILAEASLRAAKTDFDQSNLELNKEGYAWSRTASLFPGQYNYLLKDAQDKPDFKQSDKLDIAKSIGKQAVDTIKEITGIESQPAPEQVAEQQQQTIPEKVPKESEVVSDLVETEPAELEVQTTEPEKSYDVEQTSTSDVGVVDNDNVVPNSGNSIESSKPENFGFSRVYADFNYLNGDRTTQGALAESEKEVQKDISMQTFMSRNRFK